uniref:Trichome birefringence-like C-terminal domain-containing protein n=1 Tax=Solanum tuberosum TaxID=4113 RepID=M1AUZ8_SOLTU
MNSGGTGRHVGNCHLEERPNIGSSQELLKMSFEFNTVINVLLVKQNKSEAWNLNLLNVTGMTVQRRDGHLSLYYLCPRLDQLLSTTKTATTGVPD